jgi:hypothetical protein
MYPGIKLNRPYNDYYVLTGLFALSRPLLGSAELFLRFKILLWATKKCPLLLRNKSHVVNADFRCLYVLSALQGSRCGSAAKWWNEKINEIERSRVRSTTLPGQPLKISALPFRYTWIPLHEPWQGFELAIICSRDCDAMTTVPRPKFFFKVLQLYLCQH